MKAPTRNRRDCSFRNPAAGGGGPGGGWAFTSEMDDKTTKERITKRNVMNCFNLGLELKNNNFPLLILILYPKPFLNFM
jgi:hypothetical protein